MPNFNKPQFIAACAIVIIALVGTGVLVVRSGVFSSQSGDIKFTEPASGDAVSTDDVAAKPTKLCVHVVGKVNKPGLYELDSGSRIKDAITAAGGAATGADLESINLAELLQDGQQIYIVKKGQIPPPKVSIVKGGVSRAAPASSSEDGKKSSEPLKLTTPGQGTVNINTAGLNELQRLPGIGPATAQKILDYRSEHGRFQAVDELDEVKGIGPAKLEKMRPFVSL